jgi:hypothetical protein
MPYCDKKPTWAEFSDQRKQRRLERRKRKKSNKKEVDTPSEERVEDEKELCDTENDNAECSPLTECFSSKFKISLGQIGDSYQTRDTSYSGSLKNCNDLRVLEEDFKEKGNNNRRMANQTSFENRDTGFGLLEEKKINSNSVNISSEPLKDTDDQSIERVNSEPKSCMETGIVNKG